MDWNAAIEINREALKRVLAMLVAMAGLAGLSSPLAGEDGSARRGKAEVLGEPDEGSPAPTLSRHLHLAILRLLRPAESAVRRLIIVAARGLVVTLPPAYQRKAKPATLEPVLRRFGIAVVISDVAGAAAAARRAGYVRAGDVRAARPRALSLPLFDPLPGLLSLSKGSDGRRYVPAHAAPRISGLDVGATLRPLPPPPSPDDPIDATRLALRLEALASALDDLPAHARRFARLRAARRGANAAGRDAAGAQNKRLTRRAWPLRPGRPPGQLKAKSRRQEVHEVLGDLHWFAFEALEHPDTS